MTHDKMNIPDDLQYTSEHEWVRIDGATARVGITDFAQHELGDIVHVELPEVGREVTSHDQVAVVESVKSVSDVYAPVSGRVTAIHADLDAALVNADPYNDGWLFEITLDVADGVAANGDTDLLTAAEYRAQIGL